MTDPTVEAWTRENERYTDGRAEQAWAAEEISWGVFNVPESELHALPDVIRSSLDRCFSSMADSGRTTTPNSGVTVNGNSPF